MKTKNIFAAITGGLLSFTALTSFGAAPVWNNVGTDFNTGANWTGGLPGIGDTATFTGAVGSMQPNLSADITILGLKFSTAASSGYSLTQSGSGTRMFLPRSPSLA